MAMTNANMAPMKPGPDLGKIEEDPLAGVKEKVEAEIAAEAATQKNKSEEHTEPVDEKPLWELTEEDAYNLNIPINASRKFDPNALKIEMIDKNYIARWCNRNNIRQSQLVAQGFRAMTLTEVANKETLEMFVDSQGHLVFADLVAMKIRKVDYYAGLRAAYQKSLYSTNARKAAQAGASFATNNLTQTLSAGERAYMQRHAEQHADKPVYNPNIGV